VWDLGRNSRPRDKSPLSLGEHHADLRGGPNSRPEREKEKPSGGRRGTSTMGAEEISC